MRQQIQIEPLVERRDPERALERELFSLIQMTSRLEYELELVVRQGEQ